MPSLCNLFQNCQYKKKTCCHSNLICVCAPQAGPEAWGTDEASMNKILCQRSRVQLLEFFRRYEDKMEGKTVEETIDEEVGDDLQDGFLAIGKFPWQHSHLSLPFSLSIFKDCYRVWSFLK